ncbi:MAG: UDP-N-acetylmuramoyl-tripeptide--D-alanyl-D-alanine ligase [Acidobacteriota bacterium]
MQVSGEITTEIRPNPPRQLSLPAFLKYRLWDIPAARRWLCAGLYLVAWVWRRCLIRTHFVAVTGSLGKTTTKELLLHLLRTCYPAAGTVHNQNDRFGVPRSLLRVRPWHRYAVLELGIGAPGEMLPLARLVRPHTAVLLGLGFTHSTAFKDLAQRADEKAALLHGLSREGMALVNSDHPLLLDRVRAFRCRIATFGTSPEADWRADQVSGSWPDPVGFQLHHQGTAYRLQSALFGRHWVPAILAAVAAAHACGIPLETACQAVGRHPPFPGRLSATRLASGVTILRDDYNASLTALKAGLEVLGEARAQRRVLVISDFSDSGHHRPRRLQMLAELVKGKADACLLLGEMSEYGRRRLIRGGFDAERVWAAGSLGEAVALLKSRLQSGDLVLLKGRTTDHLARIAHALTGPIGCWKVQCSKTVLCDFCPELQAGPPDRGEPPAGDLAGRLPDTGSAEEGSVLA